MLALNQESLAILRKTQIDDAIRTVSRKPGNGIPSLTEGLTHQPFEIPPAYRGKTDFRISTRRYQQRLGMRSFEVADRRPDRQAQGDQILQELRERMKKLVLDDRANTRQGLGGHRSLRFDRHHLQPDINDYRRR